MPHALEHSAIFAATGAAFGLGYERRHGLLTLLLVLFAAAVEIVQMFVPGRHARLSDFIIDATAVSCGLMIVTAVSRIRSRL